VVEAKVVEAKVVEPRCGPGHQVSLAFAAMTTSNLLRSRRP